MPRLTRLVGDTGAMALDQFNLQVIQRIDYGSRCCMKQSEPMLDSPRHFRVSAIDRISPMNTPARVVIATRESPLALWQAEHVRQILIQRHPATQVELLGMTTRGDQILDRTLSKVGGKGLFVKELEVALLERRAQLAVHSLKDVPMDLAPSSTLAAVMQARGSA